MKDAAPSFPLGLAQNITVAVVDFILQQTKAECFPSLRLEKSIPRHGLVPAAGGAAHAPIPGMWDDLVLLCPALL